MSDLVGLFSLLAPFFGLIVLGALVARAAGLSASSLAGMQVFLVYVALPCLFFRLISDKPISELMNWGFIAATTLATATAFGIAFLIGWRSRLSLAESVIAGVSGSYANIGYMGPPLVLSLLGPAASAPVALIFVFDTVLLFTLVPALMSLAQVEGGAGSAITGAVGKVVRHPFVIATALGVGASVLAWRPPAAIETMVGWLAGASAPCALFLLGATVALQPIRAVPRSIPALVAVKLAAHPIIVWGLLAVFGQRDAVWNEAAIVMAALPPALNIFVLSAQYRAGVERASAALLLGTVASMVTLTSLLWLFKSGSVSSVLLR